MISDKKQRIFILKWKTPFL